MARDPSRSERVRNQTLARMHFLLGAAAAFQAACSGDKGREPKTDTAGPSGGDDGGVTSGGSVNQTTGYMVVDPVPPPSRCGNEVAARVEAKAILRPSPGGNDVVITIHPKSGGKVKLAPGAEISVYGGGTAPAKTKEVGDALEVSFLYDGHSRDAECNIPVACDSDTGQMTATVTVDPNRQIPNAELPANIRGGYGY